MRLLKSLCLLLLLLTFSSCGSRNGKVHKVKNLEIYYSDNIDVMYVKSLGDFFEENGLIHDTKQHSIKLTSNTDSFILKMILNDSLKSLSDSQLKELSHLKESIAKNVFKNLNFAIEITDAYFNTIIQP